MYDLDLVKVNKSMVKSIQLVVAVARMMPKGDPVRELVKDLEREMRDAAGECQRVLELMKCDANRPLIKG